MCSHCHFAKCFNFETLVCLSLSAPTHTDVCDRRLESLEQSSTHTDVAQMSGHLGTSSFIMWQVVTYLWYWLMWDHRYLAMDETIQPIEFMPVKKLQYSLISLYCF